MKSFSELVKNLTSDFSSLKIIKVALMGDTATHFLYQAIRSVGFDAGLNLQILEADYNQIEIQILNPKSELYIHQPEIIIVFKSSHQLLQKYNTLKPQEQKDLADDELKTIELYHSALTQKSGVKVIYYNYCEIDDSVFGNYANKIEQSFLFQIRKLNYKLMLLASQLDDLYICDLSVIQNLYGKEKIFRPSLYINTKMALNISVLPQIGAKTVDLICALNGNFKKCVILDLDNILWGGIIGDDGIENIQLGDLGIGKAFTELQYWLKKLKNRGIILAVCSKNDESTAKEPFLKHLDMILKLDDISVFAANWDNKVDNIRYIHEVVQVGFDSMVFLDDSPFERKMVQDKIPEITVPDLPEDPSDYLEYIYSLNLFEANSFLPENDARTVLYQTEIERKKVRKNFKDENDFLRSLEMHSGFEGFNKFNMPRVAQLSQRSNQFNLRTQRYSETDIERIVSSQDFFTFAFDLKDILGEYGLICIVTLKKENEDVLFIDSWLMSCRVLKRTMENFVLNTIVSFAANKGFKILKGEYIATPKNSIVKNLYSNFGFEKKENYWKLILKNYKAKKCFIVKK